MVVVNSLSVLFLSRTEAQVVLAAWIANALFMTGLAQAMGFVRLLGISHVIFWTPLVVWLFRLRKQIRFRETYGRWITIPMLTNRTSLVVDYIDMVRYLMGDQT